MDTTRIVKILDAEKGEYTEQVLQSEANLQLDEHLAPYPRTHRGRITISEEMALIEAAGGYASTPNFPDLLRQGIMFDAFSGYNETPVTWPLFCRVVESNQPQEEYLIDAGLGIAPVVHEGQDYPQAALALDSGVLIKNYKRGFRVPVTEEMRRFDQVGKVRDIAQMAGRSLRMTEEQAVWAVVTAAGNYTRDSATDDNDVGPNTAATTFSPEGLITAFTTLATMKDRKSGMYLGVAPNTLMVTPRVWFAAQQLIRAPEVMRIGDKETGGTHEVYGTGTTNVFFNLVDTIIVSPRLGDSYQWILMERGRAIYFQRVDPVQVLPPKFFQENDTWEYRARTWFGVGMKDDRFAYYSSSSTAPAVD